MKNKIQSSHLHAFTASADTRSGDLVILGNVVGVAVNDVAAGAEGIADCQGVFELPVTANTTAARFAALYVNSSTGKVTTEASDGGSPALYIGVAAAPILPAETTCLVDINFGSRP